LEIYVSDENLNPRHLQPFMDGTPLALDRIRSAWPILNLADKSYLLSALLAGRDGHPNALVWKRHHAALVDIALEDENAYVRYLAARRVNAPDRSDDDETQARLEKIGTDTSDLVMQAQLEVENVSAPFSLLEVPGQHPDVAFFKGRYNPAQFWESSRICRLAAATGTDWHLSVPDILRYAAKELLPEGRVMVHEMADVLLQNLGPDYVQRFAKRQPRPRRSSSHFNDEVEGLWKTIPDVPKDISYILLRCLPGGSKYYPIPPGIVESLDEDQLAWLLWRDDIELKELRRKLYLESDSEKVRRAAAASANFDLLDSDISRLVPSPEDSKEFTELKIAGLSILADYCPVASLVQINAVRHFLWRLHEHNYRTKHRDMESERAERIWKDGAGRSALEKEVLQYQVFELAKSLCPAGADEQQGQLPDGLKMHQHMITPGNPWQTYLNLWQVVNTVQWKELLDGLPSDWTPDSPLPD
jgi:hypothetical protein